jgi:hypothetical protein
MLLWRMPRIAVIIIVVIALRSESGGWGVTYVVMESHGHHGSPPGTLEHHHAE